MAKPDLTMILGIGGKKPKHSAPPSFDSAEEEPLPTAEAGEPEPEGDEGGEAIPPEAVCYRDAQQHCEACVYMGEDGTCSKLKIPVEPTASCNLFSATDQGAADLSMGEEMPMEEAIQ